MKETSRRKVTYIEKAKINKNYLVNNRKENIVKFNKKYIKRTIELV